MDMLRGQSTYALPRVFVVGIARFGLATTLRFGNTVWPSGSRHYHDGTPGINGL